MPIAELYRLAQRSFVDLCIDLDGDDWARPAPCTPGWTVFDIASHAAGVTLDIVAGRVEGAATEPWTAAQVERWRDTPRAELFAQWDEHIVAAASAIEAIGETRPPIDCHTHEHDVRQALGRPGNRDSPIVQDALDRFVERGAIQAIEITFVDGAQLTIPGAGEPVGVRGVSRFEVFRSRLGRRSVDQFAAYDWRQPPRDELRADWFLFGPSPYDIEE